MAASRLFFALWPDDATREALVKVQRQLAAAGGRPIHPRDLHITLAFLGQVADERLACVYAAAQRVCVPPLSFTLDRQGAWPGPRVAWAAPSTVPQGLTDLVAQLWQGLVDCGFVPEARAYRPHVTLLRKAPRLPAADLAEPIPWTAEAFVLAASATGPAKPGYVIRRSWPLCAPIEVG